MGFICLRPAKQIFSEKIQPMRETFKRGGIFDPNGTGVETHDTRVATPVDFIIERVGTDFALCKYAATSVAAAAS